MAKKSGNIIRSSGLLPGSDYVGVGVSAAILDDENRIVLQLRGKRARNERGLWKLPSGVVHWGEKGEDALLRIVKEELGINIHISKLLFWKETILQKEHQHWISRIYVCVRKSGKVINLVPEEIDEVRWFSKNTLPRNIALLTKKTADLLFG